MLSVGTVVNEITTGVQKIKRKFLVDRTGLEPATPSLQMRCSTR